MATKIYVVMFIKLAYVPNLWLLLPSHIMEGTILESNVFQDKFGQELTLTTQDNGYYKPNCYAFPINEEELMKPFEGYFHLVDKENAASYYFDEVKKHMYFQYKDEENNTLINYIFDKNRIELINIDMTLNINDALDKIENIEEKTNSIIKEEIIPGFNPEHDQEFNFEQKVKTIKMNVEPVNKDKDND